MKIFLVGLPGSGKTTLGRQLASRLGILFYDLDAEIEKSTGMQVKDIFKVHGEDQFRHMESRLLKAFGALPGEFVVATGGGAPVFFDNMKWMNDHGITIFLDVPAREIARRISTSHTERPLLAKLTPDELKDQIEFMRSQRMTFYKQASLCVSGTAILAEEVIKNLNQSSEGKS